MSKPGLEKLDAPMRAASDLLQDRCLRAAAEVAPDIDRLCGGDSDKKWNVLGSTFWSMAFVALAMRYPNEDEFLEMMRSKPHSDERLRAYHREVHDRDGTPAGSRLNS